MKFRFLNFSQKAILSQSSAILLLRGMSSLLSWGNVMAKFHFVTLLRREYLHEAPLPLLWGVTSQGTSMATNIRLECLHAVPPRQLRPE